MRIRTKIAGGLAGAAVIAGSVLAASPGLASGWPVISSRSGGAWLRASPNTGSHGIEYMGNGTRVLMICWIDAQWATGNYSSNRWFKVEPEYDLNVGYVHSSMVADQARVPECH
ncbi:MAG TPA: hypothetical protein VMV92_42370 [Streptosporangiaceae bacterium]|nr:hypothetical protein [Streptosporangiaceae bacterium]